MNIREIAKIAGVSPAAVSLVINNKKGVGEETRKHILSILEEYNYTLPKKINRTPKHILFIKYIKNGMIVEENTGFISSIMDSIDNDCRSQGYSLSIIISENNLENTLSHINYSNYQGLILLGTELESCTYPLLEKIPIPFLVIDNIMPNFNCNCVVMANKEIVYQAVSYLASLGHKDIAYFRSNMSIQNFAERSESFYESCKKLNLNFNPTNEFLLTPTLLGAYNSMKAYLEKGAKLPSCAFADNDTIAIGAIKALKEYHYKIPRDISIIGFDDIHFSAINSPSLTTMNVPKKLIGSTALKHLLNSIEDPTGNSIKSHIGATLVVRHSTDEHDFNIDKG
ncbi:LacI family DNA-binding transcriptional regulator [Anaerocolumna sp.]|uniref:LacI family DNA-binding transcriptional regulator n=1 Tax=Anaerocolumna sp. TaxID=2041569 RepID=UPI0028A8AA0D|nr:LacI family DNA-binding transcriptional regulator [Anaerocolumna sp.]